MSRLLVPEVMLPYLRARQETHPAKLSRLTVQEVLPVQLAHREVLQLAQFLALQEILPDLLVQQEVLPALLAVPPPLLALLALH